MADLEGAAKEVVLRLWSERKVQLSRTQVADMVAWCQKTTMMVDAWAPGGAAIRSEAYRSLFAREKVSGQWDIRIAKTVEELTFAFNYTPFLSRIVSRENGEPVPPDQMPDAYVDEPIGLQCMYSIGDIVFMVRYSPHKFRGDTSLDADYYNENVWIPPVTLLGRNARRIIKPNSLPVYEREHWEDWSLWTVTDNRSVSPTVGRADDGTTIVDDAAVIMGTDQFEATERSWEPLDVRSLMAQEPTRD